MHFKESLKLIQTMSTHDIRRQRISYRNASNREKTLPNVCVGEG